MSSLKGVILAGGSSTWLYRMLGCSRLNGGVTLCWVLYVIAVGGCRSRNPGGFPVSMQRNRVSPGLF